MCAETACPAWTCQRLTDTVIGCCNVEPTTMDVFPAAPKPKMLRQSDPDNALLEPTFILVFICVIARPPLLHRHLYRCRCRHRRRSRRRGRQQQDSASSPWCAALSLQMEAPGLKPEFEGTCVLFHSHWIFQLICPFSHPLRHDP